MIADAAVKRNHAFRTLLFCGVALVCLLPLTERAAPFWRYAFCLPSAWLSSMAMGVPCHATEEGYMLLSRTLPVHVTRACSGGGFFVLVLVLVAAVTARGRRPAGALMCTALSLPAAHAITLLANTSRIVTGWLTGRCARVFLSEHFHAGIHLGTGIVVFLTVLIVTYFAASYLARAVARTCSMQLPGRRGPSSLRYAVASRRPSSSRFGRPHFTWRATGLRGLSDLDDNPSHTRPTDRRQRNE